MAAMNSPNKLRKLLGNLKADYPAISFLEAKEFRWDPANQTIFYSISGNSDYPEWLLLHEVGHADLKHRKYPSDVALVLMELEAWQAAKQLAEIYKIPIDIEYIEDCMDSYRGWLHKRSRCPRCQQNGIERTRGNYYCINCLAMWSVSPSRFCRVYRQIKNTTP